MKISTTQIQQSAAATLELLGGSVDVGRALALKGQLLLAEQWLQMVASGQLVLGQPEAPEGQNAADAAVSKTVPGSG